jgi:hypothetical protein
MLTIFHNTAALIREAKFRLRENGFATDGFAGLQGKLEDGVGIEPDGDRLCRPMPYHLATRPWLRHAALTSPTG